MPRKRKKAQKIQHEQGCNFDRLICGICHHDSETGLRVPLNKVGYTSAKEMREDILKPSVRERPDKTDTELFAEWEELQPDVASGTCWNWQKEKFDAIAKELGPKLLEMRVARLEQSLKFTRKCMFEELGYKDAGNDCFTKREPWWKLTMDQVIGLSGIAMIIAAIVIVAIWA